MKNTQVLLAKRPDGAPTLESFSTVTKEVADIPRGQMLCQTLYMSVDPYMRGRMNDVPSYVPPFQLNEPCEAGVVVKVIESNDGPFPAGAYLVGMGPWAEYMLSDGTDMRQVDPAIAPLSYHLGILGMPGMTAYVGLKAIAELKEGENLFVSAASGAVGQVVGQIGKNMNCHVSGSAGSDDKVDYLIEELGFDAAFNYKTNDLNKAMKRSNPNGIDVYFENVGGPQLEAVLNTMNFNGRIAACGMIANYNGEPVPGPRNLVLVVGRSIKMQGFIVFNYPDAATEWVSLGAKWLQEGKLHYRESVAEGIANAPQAFLDMLAGKNFGKQVVKVADD